MTVVLNNRNLHRKESHEHQRRRNKVMEGKNLNHLIDSLLVWFVLNRAYEIITTKTKKVMHT